MNVLPNISGSMLKTIRESQKLSSAQMAHVFGISRNLYSTLERADIVPVKYSRLLPDYLNMSEDELFTLLESLEEIHSKKNEEGNEVQQGANPKKINDFVFKNFQDNLGNKDRSIHSLENTNAQLNEKLRQEEMKNLSLTRDIDKLEFKFENLKSEMANHQKFMEKHFTDKLATVDNRMKQMIESALNQYGSELKVLLKEENSSGLGDFLGQTGIADLLKNPAFGASLGKIIENAFVKSNDNSQNSAYSGQGFKNEEIPYENVNPDSQYNEQEQES